jgi:hypothetical protein
VLRAAGIRRLDYLALTHGDPDHIGARLSIRPRVPGRARSGRGLLSRDSSRSRCCGWRCRLTARGGRTSTPADAAAIDGVSGDRASSAARRLGAARRSGTTIRWCWSCGGATSRFS